MLPLPHAQPLSATLLATILVAGCTAPPKPIVVVPVFPPTTFLEDSGSIAVAHGSTCGQSDEEDEQKEISLPGSYTLPQYANRAVVVLNGWSFEFLNGDHELRSMKAYLKNISLKNSVLTWDAHGYIKDENFDDPYKFCYYYTTIALNDAKVKARSIPLKAGSSAGLFTSVPKGSKTDSALNVNSNYLQTEPRRADEAIALLPQGFGLGYSNQSSAIPACFDCAVDREVLQIAFRLGRPEAFRSDSYFIDRPQALDADKNIADDGYLSWDTHAALRDQDERRAFWTHEYVDLLAGADLAVIEPVFSVLPAKRDGGWFKECASRPGPRIQEIEITGIPFTYAVPMLTGWDLTYRCSDEEHLERAGIWLHDIAYDGPRGKAGGTLRYKVSSLLDDDDDVPYHTARHNITILGLTSRPPADLVPKSNHPGFCRLDKQGRLLIDVANIGLGDAPASTTRATFAGGDTVDVPTPPVAHGFAGPLQPIVIPKSCQNYETCTFTVSVDADDVVTETTETNNQAKGACAFPK
jgi:hypothetical protein